MGGYLCKHCAHDSGQHGETSRGITGKPFGYCADCGPCQTNSRTTPAAFAATKGDQVFASGGAQAGDTFLRPGDDGDWFGITAAEQAELDNLFSYHAPQGDQVDRYGVIRAQGRQLARVIMAYSRESEERNQALFAVRAAIMWANAGIACNERPDSGE